MVHSCTSISLQGKEGFVAITRTPEFETQNVSETRRTLSETLDRVRRHEARIVIERSGIPVGAIVSMDDLEDLRRVQQRREEARRVLANVRSGFVGIPEEETEREVWTAIEEVEAERRARRGATAAG